MTLAPEHVSRQLDHNLNAQETEKVFQVTGAVQEAQLRQLSGLEHQKVIVSRLAARAPILCYDMRTVTDT